MRLTLFGSSLLSAYWNGAATYYRGILRALAAHGHDITFCEPDAFDRHAHRDLREPPAYADVIIYRDEATRTRLVQRALADSDWVFKCSGVGRWDQELETQIARGGRHARTAFWDVDAPATLARLAADAADPLRDCLPRFDRVLTYGGGPPVREAYRRLGARSCTAVYNGLDPDEHRPVGSVEPRWHLLFMGNRLPDRDDRVRTLFLDAAAAAPGLRFALGGSGWEDMTLPTNVERLGHVPTADHNRVNGAALAVLNVHRESMVRNGWSPATRMFEAAGAAACQITDPWRGIEDFFEPGREILVACSAAEVIEHLRALDAPRARRIGQAGRARALRDHTYARRAADLDATLRAAARRAS